jgi:hypothetical protein
VAIGRALFAVFRPSPRRDNYANLRPPFAYGVSKIKAVHLTRHHNVSEYRADLFAMLKYFQGEIGAGHLNCIIAQYADHIRGQHQEGRVVLDDKDCGPFQCLGHGFCFANQYLPAFNFYTQLRRQLKVAQLKGTRARASLDPKDKARGCEFDKDRDLLFDEELKAIEVESRRTIEIDVLAPERPDDWLAGSFDQPSECRGNLGVNRLEKRAFAHCIRSLFHIDGDLPPELSRDEQSAFLRSPVQLVLDATDAPSDTIMSNTSRTKKPKARVDGQRECSFPSLAAPVRRPSRRRPRSQVARQVEAGELLSRLHLAGARRYFRFHQGFFVATSGGVIIATLPCSAFVMPTRRSISCGV